MANVPSYLMDGPEAPKEVPVHRREVFDAINDSGVDNTASSKNQS